MPSFFKSLWQREDGSVIVEFALLGPTLLAMFLGVLHFGIGMQNYNALRSISGDVARYAVVNYQTNQRRSTSELSDYAKRIATRAPYGLVSRRFAATMIAAPTQRVAGATEYTLTLTYNIPTMLSIIGIEQIPVSFSRPVFVVAAATP